MIFFAIIWFLFNRKPRGWVGVKLRPAGETDDQAQNKCAEHPIKRKTEFLSEKSV